MANLFKTIGSAIGGAFTGEPIGTALGLWSAYNQYKGNKDAKNAAADQARAQEIAAANAAAQQKAAAAEEKAFYENMLQKQLDQQNLGLMAGQQSAAMGMSGSLLDAQTAYKLAGQYQAQQMPYLQAQQALLSQSLPLMMQMAGQTPYQVSPNVQGIDYNGLSQGLMPQLQQNMGQIAPMLQQIFAQYQAQNQAQTQVQNQTPGPGQYFDLRTNMVTNLDGTPANKVMAPIYNLPPTNPQTPIAFSPGQFQVTPPAMVGGSAQLAPKQDLMSLLTANPEYQIMSQIGNENLNRSLTSMGKQNSSDALYSKQRVNQDILAKSYQDLYNRQKEMYGLAVGRDFSNPYTGAALTAGSQLGNAGSMGKAMQDAATGRANAFKDFSNTQGANLAGNAGQRIQLGLDSAGLNAKNAYNQKTAGISSGQNTANFLTKIYDQYNQYKLANTPAWGG